jgi:hypothetical protein
VSIGDAIAIWGAVTGTTGAVIAIAAMRRDRPSLRVLGQIRLDSYKNRDPPALVVTVTNLGKQPVAITEIGLAERWQPAGRVRRRLFPESWTTLRYGEWPPQRERDSESPQGRSAFHYAPPAVYTLNPGEAITAWDWIEEGEVRTLRAFVRDVLGRVSWASEISADDMRQAIASNEASASYYG